MTAVNSALDLAAFGPELERRTLPEQVAEKLRRLILIEKLPPGGRITERDLSEAMGISRTPLREALRILVSDGLIEFGPSKRMRVADPSLEEIYELLAVQGALEAFAGELACENASPEELDRIKALHDRMVEISDSSEPLDFFDLDMAFHTAIVECSGNRWLSKTHALFNIRLYRARFISSRNSRGRGTTLKQHSTIVAGLMSRDKDDARRALIAHLDRAKVNISERYSPADTRDPKS